MTLLARPVQLYIEISHYVYRMCLIEIHSPPATTGSSYANISFEGMQHGVNGFMDDLL